MTAGNFDRCLELVLKHEGGFVNHPRDPGGATNQGVTQAVYDAFRRKRSLATQTVRRILPAEVRAIYRAQYWDAVRGDDLPAGVDYCAFDFAVNSGVSRSAKFLQRAAGVTDDGRVGPATVAAVRGRDAGDLVSDVCTARLAFLRRLPHWPTFGKGWQRRVDDVRAFAMSMAGGR